MARQSSTSPPPWAAPARSRHRNAGAPKTVITTRQQAIRLIPGYRRTTVRRYRPEEVQLDLEASRLGVSRQLIIKEWLVERLERRGDSAGAAVAESPSA